MVYYLGVKVDDAAEVRGRLLISVPLSLSLSPSTIVRAAARPGAI